MTNPLDWRPLVSEALRRLEAYPGPGDPEARDMLREALDAVPAHNYSGSVRRWLHKKRGTTYTEVCRAQLQAMVPAPEGHVLIVYRSDDDGRYWARPSGEFLDGRFEQIGSQAFPVEDPAQGPELGRDDPLPVDVRVGGTGQGTFCKGIKLGTLLDYLARQRTHNNNAETLGGGAAK